MVAEENYSIKRKEAELAAQLSREDDRERDIDELLEEASFFSLHRVVIHLASFYLFLVLLYNFVLSYFTGDDPSWKCIDNNGSDFCRQHYNEIIARGSDMFEERCRLNRSDWAYTTGKKYSFVTQFDLICDKTALAATVGASYYLGGAFGSVFLGLIADSFGRRPIIIFSCVLTLLASVGNSYIHHVWQLFTLSVICGVGSAGAFYTTLIYLSEFTTPSLRVLTTNILLMFGTTSFLSIDLLAYYVREWEHLSAYAGWAIIPVIITFFFLPESPRWLLTKREIDHAEEIMDKLCGVKCETKYDGVRLKCVFEESDTKNYTYIDLVRHLPILKVTLSNVCLWFVIPVLYYSIALQSSSLGGDMYQAFAISTVADFPGTILSTYTSNRIGRKKSILGGLSMSGLLIGSLALVPTTFHYRYIVNISIGFVGRLMCSISFYVMYTWSMELFPTVVRSQGLSVCAISDRLGMFLVPYVTRIATQVSYKLPFIVMCLSALLATLCGLWLPETLNQPTRETFKDFFPEPTNIKGGKKEEEEEEGGKEEDSKKGSFTQEKALYMTGYDNVTLQLDEQIV